jgi:hypothetical protein
MQFYSQHECEEWLSQRERLRPDENKSLQSERFEFPAEAYRFFPVASAVARSITYRRPTLLWVTEWGIWPSSENWHLYYRLRESHGDRRLLKDAPGHLFLDYEVDDLSSYLQLAMLNGWGGYILTHANYVNAFFSHDEYIDFFSEMTENLAELRAYFAKPANAGGL